MENVIKRSLTFDENLFDCFWVVDLSNNERIYRNDIGDRDSWLVLKDYLKKNNLNINALYFKFRDNWQCIARDKKAFFFTKMVKATYGTDNTQYFFCGGYLSDEGTHVVVKKYILPEILLMEEEYRDINDLTLDRGIYWNPLESITHNLEQIQL